jgi:hypothetical protein
MKIRFVSLALIVLALFSPVLATAATPQTKLTQFKPMFRVLRYHGLKPLLATGGLPQWTGSYKYKGQTYHFTMVGRNPASNNATTTIPVVIIPIKMVFGASNGAMTFNPATKKVHGVTVIQRIINSPIFDGSLDFTQGGTDVGQTQYIDAYQRGSFWSAVSTHPNYHTLLGTPTVLAEQTIHVKASQGQVISAFGVAAGLMNVNDYDKAIQAFIATFPQITPKVLPIFVTYNIYLSDTSDISQCCIGGYHSYNGVNSYMTATFVDVPGAFAQDVSALSHEVGEWLTDPFTNNTDVPALCGTTGNDNQILEVGDPLEGLTNYGAYPYSLNSFTYNLQDLVFISYFGAPLAKSVNSWWTFQGISAGVCVNGG